MANPEHLKILKKGVAHWNKWRKKNPDIEPDLSGADLSGVNLSEADLSDAELSDSDLYGADLSEANLSNATLIDADLFGANLENGNMTLTDLSGANLGEAKLAGANLTQAILIEASLVGANLSGANLNGAELDGADLWSANLKKANLTRTNLSGVKMGAVNLSGVDLEGAYILDTVFANVDLSTTKNLDKLQSGGPSIIDHQTLIRSGKLPEVFLKSCGFPDSFIEYLPSLLGSLNSIDFYSCFISYSHKDEEFAKRLYADLQAEGVRCWFAQQDLDIGDKIKDKIDEAIRIHDKLIIVLSENSLTRAWVVKEVKEGLKEEEIRQEDVLFPIRLDEAVEETTQQWAFDLKAERVIGDFSNWKNHDDYKKALELLLRALGKKAEKETKS